MTYTSNVPQGTQQIAATQAPILDNFTFLSTGIGIEHNFNSAGTGTDMYHLKASMPNIATPGALPAGTNGIYYVKGGAPKFYDQVNGEFNFATCFPATGGLNSYFRYGNVNLGTNHIFTLPNQSGGNYWILNPTGTSYSMGIWVTVNGILTTHVSSSSGVIISTNSINKLIMDGFSTANATFNYAFLINVTQ